MVLKSFRKIKIALALDSKLMGLAQERSRPRKVPVSKLPMARSRTNGRQSGVNTRCQLHVYQIQAGTGEDVRSTRIVNAHT